MDGLNDIGPGGDGDLAPAMPAESPLVMPEQDLTRFDPASRRNFIDPRRSRSPLWPRLLILGGALLLVAAVTYEMYRVLDVGDLTTTELIVLVLFSINFAWISLAFMLSLAGFAIIVRRRHRGPVVRSHAPIVGRTAMLMPTYNEDPERVFAAVEAMARQTAAMDGNARFDWFILSDTSNPTILLEEESALLAIRSRLGRSANVHYRHRRHNTARKAGNIADFCRRWGGDYDYLIVLDADSLMEPETILELVRRMEADPDAGLIQTVPTLVHGRTVLARLQQFASRIYGPAIAGGLAWMSGAEGNYWGHNAIVRRRAFVAAAGLPVLSGSAPFGGHVLSHDFVEAALIRRAGWTVRIADDLHGSFEEVPPTLIDLAIRDRRWCQGNLQHLRLITGRGLHWISRLHLLTGIMSYLASPLWLLLLLAGLGMSLQAQFARPEYFGESFQLFPTWPVIDPERSLRLLGITVLVLLGPKLVGLVLALTDRAVRQPSGGAWRLTASCLFETLASALIAPIMMLIQSGIVIAILRGQDAGWSAQRRDLERNSIGELFGRHRLHMAAGLLLALVAETISPVMLAWLLPAVAGLVLAIPLSGVTASSAVGDKVARAGLLLTPEGSFPPPLDALTASARRFYSQATANGRDIVRLLRDDQRRRIHFALLDRFDDRKRGHVDPVHALAAAKIAEAHSVEEALSFLDEREQLAALAMPELCERLAALPVSAPG